MRVVAARIMAPTTRCQGIANPVASSDHKNPGPDVESCDQRPEEQERQVGRYEEQQERYPYYADSEHYAEHEDYRQRDQPVDEGSPRRLLSPAGRRGQRPWRKHGGEYGTGSERKRRAKPAKVTDYDWPVGLVQVERHAPRHHIALHGAPVAGDLTALAPEVTRDLGVWSKVHGSPSYVYVPLDGSVHVNVPELGANVAFDGAFDLHITETRVDVALHLAAYEDVPKPGMHVVHYQSVYFEVTGPGRNVVLDSSMTNHDISNEPLLRRVRGERREYDETEDHDRDGKQGQGVDPNRGYGEVHASLARRRETAR